MTKKTLSPSAYHTDRNLVSSVDDEDYGVFVQRGSSRGANQSALTEQKMTNVSLGVVHRVCIVLQTLNAHGLLVLDGQVRAREVGMPNLVLCNAVIDAFESPISLRQFNVVEMRVTFPLDRQGTRPARRTRPAEARKTPPGERHPSFVQKLSPASGCTSGLR